MDLAGLISKRSRGVDASGIRRVFDLGARMTEKIDLSIGQPHFRVPDAIKRAAIEAIEHDHNGYTPTQGILKIRERIARHLESDVGWTIDTRSSDADPERPAMLVCSGTSGALVLAFLALLDPGDEVIMSDPYFVAYPALAAMAGAKAVRCETYPDFRMTAARVAPLITARTKIVLLNSPGNPSGWVATGRECAELLEMCRKRGVLLISDEIYDSFTYPESREPSPIGGEPVCPSPARIAHAHRDVLLIRGFGKTYGITGWRLGYAAGPRWLVDQMAKIQQCAFVCAPAPLQHAGAAALDTDVSEFVDLYRRNRDTVVERLSPLTELTVPGGSFYAFLRVPERLGQTGWEFFERARERKLLIVPGKEFSTRDSHFRISYATSPENLRRGLDVLCDLMAG